MVKANELRVGNLLNYQTAEGDVVTLTTDFGTIQWATDDSKGFNLVHSPIPLTEEWLTKFGFEKPSVCGSYVILYLNDENKPSSLQIPLFRKDVIQICRSGICAYEAKCEFVHQLQNLYFALTGEELEIKGGNNE